MSDDLVGCTKVDLYEILLKVCFRNKLRSNQLRLTSTCSIISSLSTSVLLVLGMRYKFFTLVLFLVSLNKLNFSLPVLKLGFKCTSLNPGFSVRTPEQFDTIY